MKKSKFRTGKEVYEILKPLYNAASSQIRQHFLDPGVILVLAGVHPAVKIVINNPSQEIFHEIRTLNLLLKKNKARLRISTKYLRKEVNNLQRLASIIIESINGYERLSQYAFPKENILRAARGFEDVEKWRRERILKDKKTQKSLLDAIEEGEISHTELSLIDDEDKDILINDFLSLQTSKNKENSFLDDKFFNLLQRINHPNLVQDHSFDEVLRDIRIIIKNSHLLRHGLENKGLSHTTIEILNEMLLSKYSLIKKVAQEILIENSETITKKLKHAETFPMHSLEKKIYEDTIKNITSLTK